MKNKMNKYIAKYRLNKHENNLLISMQIKRDITSSSKLGSMKNWIILNVGKNVWVIYVAGSVN